MLDSVRGSHVVLLIGLVCVVQTIAQVCPYNHTGCECLAHSVSCHYLDETPPLQTGDKVSNISDLSFKDGNLTTIIKNSLLDGLASISFIQLPLTNISDDAFETSATTLHRLDIERTLLDTLPGALSTLTSLVELDIENTPIQHWDNAATTLHEISKTLEDLTLNRVGLSAWPTWISNFHLLRKLELSHNPLTSIPDDALNSVKDTLTYLELREANLTHVPQAITILSSLTNLDLSANMFRDHAELEKITASQFAPVLSTLHIESTGLTQVPDFSSLISLKMISLQFNQISSIPAGFLPPSLENLFLGYNKLLSIPAAVATLPQLSILNVGSNQITNIEPNSLPSSLITLDLSFNKLTSITNTTFRNLNHLWDLELEFNPISTISPSAFSDLVSLAFISMAHTQLTEIPLALLSLRHQTEIYLNSAQPLSCPCPADPRLVQWFTSPNKPQISTGNCGNGQTVASYLSGQCGH